VKVRRVLALVERKGIPVYVIGAPVKPKVKRVRAEGPAATTGLAGLMSSTVVVPAHGPVLWPVRMTRSVANSLTFPGRSLEWRSQRPGFVDRHRQCFNSVDFSVISAGELDRSATRTETH
jgi:hypothetical protein